MEISSEKSKVMVAGSKLMVAGCQEHIKESRIRITVEGKDLEQVSNFIWSQYRKRRKIGKRNQNQNCEGNKCTSKTGEDLESEKHQ